MSKYIVYKSQLGLVIHINNTIHIERNKLYPAYTINCSSCTQCEAHKVECSNGRNEIICEYIEKNLQNCLNNSIKTEQKSRKDFIAVPVCCNFNLDSVSFNRNLIGEYET